MDLMPGNLSRIICHRFNSSLPVFRGSKGSIRKDFSLQQLRRPYRIHTLFVSANAVIMWCMECIWISYCMRLLDRAPVCMGGEAFSAHSFWFPFLSGVLEIVAWLLGWRQVRAVLYACIYRGLSDLTCAAVFLCSIAAPPYPDLPFPVCLPLHHVHPPLLCVPDLTYFSVIVVWLDCITQCSL